MAANDPAPGGKRVGLLARTEAIESAVRGNVYPLPADMATACAARKSRHRHGLTERRNG